jgi:Zn ribbon nucleic-acid-binding protein
MDKPSPILCPACHRLMALRMLQTEDKATVAAVECRDCGILFNLSRLMEEEQRWSLQAVPASELRVTAARRKTKRRPLSARFSVGRSVHWRR